MQKAAIVNTTFARELIEPIANILGIELKWIPDSYEFQEFEEGMSGRF